MITRLPSTAILFILSLAALGACVGDDEATSSDGSGGGASAGQGSGQGCGAQVKIAFYTDPGCTAQVGQRVYDTTETCFSWTANGSHAGENSATRFQCYADRLCYTQHANTHACDDGGFGQTDKQARVGVCVKEPEGLLYAKILGGTESCPPAPEGFECPASESQQGTPGLAACTSEP
jgi:hypothetical protein